MSHNETETDKENILLIYFREREREASANCGESRGKRESQTDSALVLGVDPSRGLSPTTLRSRPEPKPGVGGLMGGAAQDPTESYTAPAKLKMPVMSEQF